MVARLRSIQARLRSITHDCRTDMHEPDEQHVTAHVIGNHLDNAMGDHIVEELIEVNSHELVVIIQRGGEYPQRARFNLADLIALARAAELD